MNDEREAERAYHYLAETDEDYARAKALAEARKYMLKVAFSTALLETPDGTVSVKEALAFTSDGYKQAIAGYHDAVLEYETLKAKRERARLAIERWRTLESSRRVGLS